MRAPAIAALTLFAAGIALAQTQPVASVQARGETVPVGTSNDDAADDPAIWRNPRDPVRSLIVGTDKKAGLYVYGLDGQVKHFEAAGRVNNVDLVEMGRSGVIVAASDRNDAANARLQFYRLDSARGTLSALGSVAAGAGEAYGVCLLKQGRDLTAFSVLKDGTVHQLRIALTPTQPPVAEVVRSLKLETQAEGCVADPRSGTLYVGEEARGVWAFPVDPGAGSQGRLVAPADGVQLVADVEGLALMPQGRRGGWLVVSSQGDNAYALYRLPEMAPAGRFRIAPGRFGSTEETDGIELARGSFGRDYPEGLFVAQDGVNPPAAQNFKLVSWRDVIHALGR